MTFKDSKLWKRAFYSQRADASEAEQQKLAATYEAMRGRASALVSKIDSDLPHMTVHDVTHLDALWEMASIAAGDEFELNPAEAFVFGGAVLLHDAAMTLAAFPNGLADLMQTVEWRDAHARHIAGVSPDDKEALIAADRRAVEDSLRILHAKHAENLPGISWTSSGGDKMFIIEDSQLRNFYGPKIGKIAYSHWWTIHKVEDELSGTLGGLAGITECTVDLLKVACLLRVADAMHLDQRRAPSFDLALVKPSGVSADHWVFQERMALPYVQGDALVYTAQPPFGISDADAWWTAFDALQMVDGELRSVDRVLRDHQKIPLGVRRVEGVQTPSDLARTIETIGWEPVNSTVRVSDVPKIVSTLGGSKLYGEGPTAPVRELIQNGLDAITARRRLQSRPTKWGELTVSLSLRDDGHWLSVEDCGVGMSTSVLTGPLIDFGNSFWKSSLAMQEFPGLAAAGMKARGKYGIGFFSIFMLGDHVRVISRRYDQDANSAKVLEFKHGLGSRPNLSNAPISDAPIDGGTRIEVKLSVSPIESGGLLHRKTFNQETLDDFATLVASLAPATDVNLRVVEYGEEKGRTDAGDWLTISDKELLKRIAGKSDHKDLFLSKLKLLELRDDEGRVYGRAKIDTRRYNQVGLITVDGLAASRIGSISGILKGVETTAARNNARPIAPQAVLASWASEQALLFSALDVPDYEKAIAADIVLTFRGQIADLPVVLWDDDWLSVDDFAEKVHGLSELYVHEGTVDHDDEDDVTRKDFDKHFEITEDLVTVVDSNRSTLRASGWIESVTNVEGDTTVDLIEAVLFEKWGDVEAGDIFYVVGKVNGAEITRRVTQYVRIDHPSDDGEDDRQKAAVETLDM